MWKQQVNNPLRILLTNISFSTRSGTETYIRDIVLGLLRNGHLPLVYSPLLGEFAQEIRATSVPVVDNLKDLPITPDIIHGHHHPETMTALLHFPNTPLDCCVLGDGRPPHQPC